MVKNFATEDIEIIFDELRNKSYQDTVPDTSTGLKILRKVEIEAAFLRGNQG